MGPGAVIKSPAIRLLLSAGLAASLAACTGGNNSADPTPEPAPPSVTFPTNGLGDVTFYLHPDGNGPKQVRALTEQGKVEQAQALAPIASHSTAVWFGGETDPFAKAAALTEAAMKAGQVPIIVAYNVTDRDCGLYSSGGAESIDAYLTWLGSMAAGIGDRPAVVVVEPDAIAHAVEGCEGLDSPEERYRLLTEAVKILKRQPATRIYLDAGNASWIEDIDALAGALEASGIAQADGFSLNVSNFETNEVTAAYGLELSRRIEAKDTPGRAPKGFLIDTSRNGAGPPALADDGDHSNWCNPPNRRLGVPPTTDTDLDRVDAFVWIKQPGDSDGECRGGAPPAGQWFPEYAAELLAG